MPGWEEMFCDSDLAEDVREIYRVWREETRDVAEITRRLWEEFDNELNTPAKRARYYLCLVHLQLDDGTVLPDTRNKVLALIESGQWTRGWRGASEERIVAMEEVLDKLRERLRESADS